MDTTATGIGNRLLPYGRIGLAVALVGSSLVWPQFVSRISLPLALVLIALLGIPHGAADYALYSQLAGPPLSRREKIRFFVRYLGLILLYGLWWWLEPVSALLFFLLISVVHFGRSGRLRSSRAGGMSRMYELCRGAFLLGFPLLWHYEQTAAIVGEILRRPLPELPVSYVQSAAFGLGLLLFSMVLLLRWRGRLPVEEASRELSELLLLAVVFVCLPLLLGFALFFCCWHAWDAMGEQMAFFREKIPEFGLKSYFLLTLPFALLALLGIAGGVFWMRHWQDAVGLGWMFAGIAMITLPHIWLVDGRFHAWQDQTTRNLAKSPAGGLIA